MNQVFNKYQGAGNDFIIIDNRQELFDADNSKLINKMCDRRFGIGADGLILVSNHNNYDYEMKYFNSDGKTGTMCGNGGRCVSHFAYQHGIAGRKQIFMGSDGIHESIVSTDSISLKMCDVQNPKIIDGNLFIDTGSPHYVVFKDDVADLDVFNEGRKLRWSEAFAPGGTNVDFVQKKDNCLFVRTFERGVEDETLACGTGVTASAIASVLSGYFDSSPVHIQTRGGNLTVDFNIKHENLITNIWLTGPATFVFEGTIII